MGRLIGDDRFEVQFVVPGQTEDAIEIIATNEALFVTQDKDTQYAKAFEIMFASDSIDFRKFEATRHNGVVTITCELRGEETPETTSTTI